jgi:hypothetical protein
MFSSHGAWEEEKIPNVPFILDPLFPTCSADTRDGERLAQEPLSQCASFRANVRDWGQKMSRFQGIYQIIRKPDANFFSGANTDSSSSRLQRGAKVLSDLVR